MKRDYLINHIIGEGCYADEGETNSVAELWHNCINGESCYVPYDDELELMTYCHIFYELKVQPPLEYDSDYDVYSSFREHLKNKIIEG